jgi:hypothetical protein
MGDFPPYINVCKPLMEKYGLELEYFLGEKINVNGERVGWTGDTLFQFLCHDFAENQIRENLKQIQVENSLFDK